MTNLYTDTAAGVLDGMLSTLAEPARWTKGASARTIASIRCEPLNPDAICWSIYGAAERELAKFHTHPDPQIGERIYDEIDDLLHGLTNNVAPSAINDCPNTTHEDIIGLLSLAQSRASLNA